MGWRALLDELSWSPPSRVPIFPLVITKRHTAGILCLTLLASALFLWEEAGTASHPGYPLDDSWIHAQIARNLVNGDGFAFNPGEPVAGSTAPLWTLVFSFLSLLPLDTVWAVKGFGVFALFVTGLLTARLAMQSGLDREYAGAAALFVVMTPRLVWGAISGMEVTLYAALSTGAIVCHLASRERPTYPETILFALASLARPECLILFPIAAALRIVSSDNRAEVVRTYIPQAAVFALTLSPAIAFNVATIGSPFPNTFHAKVGPYGLLGAIANADLDRIAKTTLYYPLLQLWDFVAFSAGNNLLITLLAGLALVKALRHRSAPTGWLIPVAIVAFPLIRGMVAPFKGPTFQNGRYAAHFVPIITVLGVTGLAALLKGRASTNKAWAIVIFVILLSQQAGWIPHQARSYARDVAAINEVHVEMGRWLSENTTEDAVVATHDIGAIRYFSDRRVIDTIGLVTPEVLDYLKPRVAADGPVLSFLKDVKPDYFVSVPSWYPELTANRTHLTPVHELRPKGESAVGGDRLVVYKATWP